VRGGAAVDFGEYEMSTYAEIAKINVNEHVEKKNGLSYLSWAWAVDKLLRLDPVATWEYREPVRYGDTMMVFCTVTAFGVSRTAQLPVMDHRNKAISNPDAFAVNTAMQRCLAKAVALHGLGLYIYAGEDMPLEEREAQDERQDAEFADLIDALETAAAGGTAKLMSAFKSIPNSPAKIAAWKEHGARLKAMAAKQDEAA